ncbi:hypothetical protein K439DRAFT_1194362 [Ramaria rubella]|nr:hypothetical protein K439DRAFT_1194362 [Ramaria rubella]
MSKARKLEKAMALIKMEDIDGHKQIYFEHMDPQGVPPISALIYGTTRILLPEMHWDSTCDLLDAFSLAEELRQQAVADAREALLWDQFYRKGGAADVDGEPLTDQERKTLKAIVKKANVDILRETYRTLVMQVCWAHIHRLRRSGSTFVIPFYFCRYFPTVDDLRTKSEKDHPLWLRGISGTELIAYEVIRGKVMDFLDAAEEWEEQYLRESSRSPSVNPRLTPEFQARFCERFPLLVEWDTLASIFQRHLTKVLYLSVLCPFPRPIFFAFPKVQSMITKLHAIFPDSDLPGASMELDYESSSLAQRESPTCSVHPFLAQKVQSEEQSEISRKKHMESQESNVSSKISYVDGSEEYVPPVA